MKHVELTIHGIREFFLGVGMDWQTYSMAALKKHEEISAWLLCRAQYVENEMTGRAWTTENSISFRARICGNWRPSHDHSVLPDKVRNAVPSWKGKMVAVQLDDLYRSRLTSIGRDARDRIATFPHLAELFIHELNASATAPRVSVRLLNQWNESPGAVRKDQLIEKMEELLAQGKAIAGNVDIVRTAVTQPESAHTMAKKPFQQKRANRAANIEKLTNCIKLYVQSSQEADRAALMRGQVLQSLAPITQRQLAEMSGLSDSVVSRCLNDSSADLLRLLWLRVSGADPNVPRSEVDQNDVGFSDED